MGSRRDEQSLRLLFAFQKVGDRYGALPLTTSLCPFPYSERFDGVVNEHFLCFIFFLLLLVFLTGWGPIVRIILDFIRDDDAIPRAEEWVLRIRVVSDPLVRSAASSKMETK